MKAADLGVAMRTLLTLLLIVPILLMGCEQRQETQAPAITKKMAREKKPTPKVVKATWVVLGMTAEGTPYRCWALEGRSNPPQMGEGRLTWQSTGLSVSLPEPYHLAGGFNESVYQTLGITKEVCEELNRQVYSPKTGRYETPAFLPLEKPIKAPLKPPRYQRRTRTNGGGQ